MSQTDQDKSMDKKEIAEEEREKMLNAENTKHTGAAPAPDLESEDQKPKKKIPIGGIKMPGFCRTKSKEPCKDDETKPTETAEPESVTVTIKEGEHPLTTDKPTTPVKEVKDKEAKEKEGRKGILDAIRLPLVSVFPRKKNKEGDAELAMTGTAGLASVETLDDSGVNEKSAPTADDGMETVRLDGDVVEGVTPPKPHPIIVCLSTARRNLLVTVATFFILLAVIIIICIACAGPKRIVSPPLKENKFIETITSCGPVQGVLEDGAFAFRGIPYALPPVNARRWLPAELFRRIEYCWNGTYLAHNASEMCWQREASGRIDGVEDCLYLDVFTPYVRYDSPLPVVVMIGAETLTGASPGIMQPSAKLARVRDIVFVRPNFRLGVFGFLASEKLSRTIHPPTSGNYGLSDIVAALQWVQFNIENFGGNPKSVTLWGHRAGGTLVTALVGARKARGLFSRAWISSGGTVFPRKSLQEYEALNEQYIEWLGCKDDTCLRNQGAEDLMKGMPETWYLGNAELPKPQETTSDKRHEWLVLDGAILQENVEQNWKQNGLPVKLVMGTTAQSGTPLHLLAPNASLESTEVVNKVWESLLGTRGLAEEALRRYNATLHGLTTMISDIRVVCPLLMLARKNSTIPFYVTTQPRGNLADPDSDAAAILGTYAARTPEEKRHVSAMQQLFNHFVWHGKVSEVEFAPLVLNGPKNILVVGEDISPQRDYPNCEFWINNNIVPTFARVD